MIKIFMIKIERTRVNYNNIIYAAFLILDSQDPTRGGIDVILT